MAIILPILLETCRCSARMPILKRILPPIVSAFMNDSFTSTVEAAVKDCCSTCLNSTTTVTWEIDTHGQGILTAEDLFEEIEHGKQIYLPHLQRIYSLTHAHKTFELGKFVPLLKSPGTAVIGSRRHAANEAAGAIADGLLKSIPIIFLGLLSVFFFACLLWVMVSSFCQSLSLVLALITFQI